MGNVAYAVFNRPAEWIYRFNQPLRRATAFSLAHREMASDTYTLTRASEQWGQDDTGLLVAATSGNAAFWGTEGILIEPAATNLLTYTATFTNAAWTKTGVTQTDANGTAPDGTTTGVRLVSAGSVAAEFASQPIATGTSSRHTVVLYIQSAAVGTTTASVGIYNSTDAAYNAQTATVLDGTAQVSGAGPIAITGLNTSTWSRIAITLDAAPAAKNLVLRIHPGTHDATEVASIRVWHPMALAGVFVSSIVPSATTAATRAAAALSMTQHFPTNDFTFQVKCKARFSSADTSGVLPIFCLYGDATNYIKVVKTATAGQIQATCSIGGVAVTATISSMTWALGDGLNVRIRKNATGFYLWVNSSTASVTSSIAPNAFSTVPSVVRLGRDESTTYGSLVVRYARAWGESKSDGFIRRLT